MSIVCFYDLLFWDAKKMRISNPLLESDLQFLSSVFRSTNASLIQQLYTSGKTFCNIMAINDFLHYLNCQQLENSYVAFLVFITQCCCIFTKACQPVFVYFCVVCIADQVIFNFNGGGSSPVNLHATNAYLV